MKNTYWPYAQDKCYKRDNLYSIKTNHSCAERSKLFSDNKYIGITPNNKMYLARKVWSIVIVTWVLIFCTTVFISQKKVIFYYDCMILATLLCKGKYRIALFAYLRCDIINRNTTSGPGQRRYLNHHVIKTTCK
jgi:hypothetical protein